MDAFDINNNITVANPMTSRQSQSMLLQVMPTLLGMAASGKLTPFIMPTLIKIVILPLLHIINTISKAFIFIGIIAYLITFTVPLILKHFGFIAFIARDLDIINTYSSYSLFKF